MSRIMVLMNRYRPEERETRERAVRAAASPTDEVGVTVMENSPGGGAVTEFHRSLMAPHVARAARAAQDAGYEAVVLWGTLDLGIEESRHIVDIPILGPGRTVCLATLALVERFGVVCYDTPWIVMFNKLTRQWGVDGRIVGIRSISLPHAQVTQQPDVVFDRFVERGRELIALGAEAIVPLGLSIVPTVIPARRLEDALGVPVPDALAITMRMAGALAASGVTNSRLAYPLATLPEAPASPT